MRPALMRARQALMSPSRRMTMPAMVRASVRAALHKLFDLGALGLDTRLRAMVSAMFSARARRSAVYNLHGRELSPRLGRARPRGVARPACLQRRAPGSVNPANAIPKYQPCHHRLRRPRQPVRRIPRGSHDT